jgi:hypothetical protein
MMGWNEVAYRAPCGCAADENKIVLAACPEAVRLIETIRDNVARNSEYVQGVVTLDQHYKAAFTEENRVQTGP